jgi:ribosome-associated toxin RatA of RatAB toxin-antitoxin module
MRQVEKSVLVPYTQAQMFALVADLASYPAFVPWVSQARVIEQAADYIIGQLEMHRAGVRETFTTRNSMRAPSEIHMELVEGPFKTLSGLWTFEDIAGRGSQVKLRMRFEFANPMVALLLSRSFEKSCIELIDAFVSRAREVYGSK